jgi:hypothetical protein
MASRVAAGVFVNFLLLALTGCVLIGGEQSLGGDGTSPREQRATRLVEARAGEPVECKDTAA